MCVCMHAYLLAVKYVCANNNYVTLLCYITALQSAIKKRLMYCNVLYLHRFSLGEEYHPSIHIVCCLGIHCTQCHVAVVENMLIVLH